MNESAGGSLWRMPECEHRPVWSVTAAPRDTARDRIIAAASTLFCHDGFTATGIDAVIARAGTAKATLYNHFPSKAALIVAVLEAEGDAWRHWFFERLAKLEQTPQARLLGAFDILYDWFADPYFYGCPYIKAASEFDSRHADVHGSVAHHKRHMTAWLKADLAAAGVDDVDQATRCFVVLIDGAIVAAQSSGDPAFALNAKQLAKMYIR
ncbi:TetR/AcrR family transcriptional regulator [Citreimonas sp.]|uniref:TetR/AcrR family transcriptional regulator n=1 Tax=Citreimonas sp. TaxID=3036715 RepID=UPI004059D976